MLPAGTESTVAAQEYRLLAQGWGRESQGLQAVPPQGAEFTSPCMWKAPSL